MNKIPPIGTYVETNYVSFTLHKNASKNVLKKKITFNTRNVKFVYIKCCKNHI